MTVLCVSWNYNLKKIHLHLHGTQHLEYQDGGDDFQVLDMRDADSFTSAIKTENRITLPKVDLDHSKDYIDIKRQNCKNKYKRQILDQPGSKSI